MNILELYEKYDIPPNLQTHMMMVAAVGSYIMDHWVGPKLTDRNELITALLLHDTGNIIKYDFKHNHLMGEEANRIDYWKRVQKDFIAKYGNDEHTATITIAKEVGVNSRTMELLNAIGSSKFESASRNPDWSKRIAPYADLRVAPSGIVTVNERFDEINKRYQGRLHTLGNKDVVESRRKYCLEVEAQLQTMLEIELLGLSEAVIKPFLHAISQHST